ncbi:MAG: LamG domain-containing protein [Minisyncoccales bacterium]
MIKKDKAFTLVELLVVVAVLALLASIVFSNLTGAREQAKISNALSFQSNMHNLLGADLVGWWNFDDDTGNIAKDSSGYGNNGTIVGATRVDGVPGTGGKAMEFNGSGNYVNIPKALIPPQGSWTFSVWVNVPKTPLLEHGSIFVQDSAGSGMFYAYTTYGTADGRIRFNGVGTTEILVGLDIRGSGWKHLLLQRDGRDFTLYVDGDFNVSGNNSGDVNSDDSIKIGHGGASGLRWLDGLIDDVRIYSRALTAYEVQTLYAQTKDNYLAEEQ